MATQSQRWFAEPMMLLVVGIPLTSVIVSFIFLFVAIRSFDGVVEDDYYRQGKEINRLLMRDDTARRLQLNAAITIGAERISVVMSAAQTLDWPSGLTLRLMHPTRDGRDLALQLEKDNDARAQIYRANIPLFETGDWIVQIETPTWRLMRRGRYGNQTSANLTPQVE